MPGPRSRTLAALLAGVPLLALLPGRAPAQYDSRPWLDWRTVETPHFTVHFPREAEAWARPVAERLEGVRGVVGAIVGHVPARRVQVVVEDPFNVANGAALPFLDRPTTIFWTTPPTPRQAIGDFRAWPELLATHEYAHLAHLTRPSRNRRERLLQRLSPYPVGPITPRAPRWVIEGYASYVEGRVTASGRPHNAFRAAVLRQLALEGKLPTYGQLNGSDVFLGGNFAYLVGSAFLENVAGRDGRSGSADSSLAFLWRRMTARTKRDFGAAFSGLYGAGPADEYARFAAELTLKAAAFDRARRDSGAVSEGALVQRLSWETGDPALSRDGRRVALVLRSREEPPRVVVWRTGADSVSPRDSAARARAARRRRPRPADSLDVPDRRFLPPARRALATLRSPLGGSWDSPRFLADGERLLVTRLVPVGDGSLRPDLFVWNSRRGTVRRVTHGAAVRDADPAPDDRSALGVRCTYGTCDVVRVELASGAVRTVLAGAPARTFYRPRWSPDGTRFVVAMHDGARWRLMLADADGAALRPVPGGDDVDRYDATFDRDGGSLVAVAERGGVCNLERIDLTSGASVALTRVSGAALAPAPGAADGSIWFLSLHARGYDVRRLGGDTAGVRAGTEMPRLPLTPGLTIAVTTREALEPVLPVRPTRAALDLPAAPVGAARGYGLGPRTTRWLPGGLAGVDGAAARLTVTNADPIGRLSMVAALAVGDPGTWRGGQLALAWRGWRPTLWGEAALAAQRPSRSRAAGWERAPIGTALDVELRGGALGMEIGGDWASRALRLRAGAQLGQLRALGAVQPSATRALGAALVDASLRQRGSGWSAAQRLVAQSSAGVYDSACPLIARPGDCIAGESFVRSLVTLAVGTGGRRLLPFSGSVTYGAVDHAPNPFERFTVGGSGAAPMDPLFLSQRLAMPMLPTGTLVGSRLLAYRASVPVGRLSAVYTGASTTERGRFARWERVAAAELSFATAAIPLVALPSVSLVGGIGRALDQRGRPIRGYVTILARP